MAVILQRPCAWAGFSLIINLRPIWLYQTVNNMCRHQQQPRRVPGSAAAAGARRPGGGHAGGPHANPHPPRRQAASVRQAGAPPCCLCQAAAYAPCKSRRAAGLRACLGCMCTPCKRACHTVCQGYSVGAGLPHRDDCKKQRSRNGTQHARGERPALYIKCICAEGLMEVRMYREGFWERAD